MHSVEFSMWVIFLILPSNFATYAAARVTAQGKKLETYMGKLLNHYDNEEVCEKVRMYSNFLLYFILEFYFFKIKSLQFKLANRKLIFSCGFFNIDLPFRMSAIATIATYIIIITQFEKEMMPS
jgi:7tm Chemosensory receptor